MQNGFPPSQYAVDYRARADHLCRGARVARLFAASCQVRHQETIVALAVHTNRLDSPHGGFDVNLDQNFNRPARRIRDLRQSLRKRLNAVADIHGFISGENQSVGNLFINLIDQ